MSVLHWDESTPSLRRYVAELRRQPTPTAALAFLRSLQSVSQHPIILRMATMKVRTGPWEEWMPELIRWVIRYLSLKRWTTASQRIIGIALCFPSWSTDNGHGHIIASLARTASQGLAHAPARLHEVYLYACLFVQIWIILFTHIYMCVAVYQCIGRRVTEWMTWQDVCMHIHVYMDIH